MRPYMSEEKVIEIMQNPDEREVDWDKVTSVEHIKTIFKEMGELKVEYQLASDDLRDLLKDPEVEVDKDQNRHVDEVLNNNLDGEIDGNLSEY